MEKPLKDYIVIYDYNDDYSSYGTKTIIKLVKAKTVASAKKNALPKIGREYSWYKSVTLYKSCLYDAKVHTRSWANNAYGCCDWYDER